ncbi:hypothetical protein LPJ74_003279 [Coemansia sp. RSA 1843]|nr:hypothetical protein LPJ74_003279 [Coemansia sp. RSA 1843]
MSGGNKNTDPSSRFISANDIEEARKERENAWKHAYDKPEDELDGQGVPEQEYDPRTLYERLQEQKRRKTEAHEESRRFANQIRKLDIDEIEFLDAVDDEEGKRYTEARRAEAEQLAKYKDDLVAVHDSSNRRTTGNARVHKRATVIGSRKPLFSLQGIVELKKPKAAVADNSSSVGSSEPAKDDDVNATLREKMADEKDSADKKADEAESNSQDPLGLLASYGDSDSESDGNTCNSNDNNNNNNSDAS